MKKILLILIVSVLFWNTAWAYTYPYEFTKHTGKYTAVKDNSQMNLTWYLTPLLISDDSSVWIRSSWFSIQWAKYTTFLRNNWIYWINSIIDFEVFWNISNNPLGLFFENEKDPMSILKDKNLKLISQWLPIYLNANLYNILKNKDSNELYSILNWTSYISDTKAPWIQIKWKIKDFNVKYEVEICENNTACAIELLPLKEEFIRSWISENPMKEEEFLEKFHKIIESYTTEAFEVNTKIFVAEEIIVNWKNITTIWDKNGNNVDYSSYDNLRKIHISKLKENEIKVLDKLVKTFRTMNAKWKTKQVQDYMKQIKSVVDNDFKKMTEIVKKYWQWTPDSYIVAQNPSLTKLREKYKLLSTYHTILTPILNEWLEKEKKKIEEKRALELKVILEELLKWYKELDLDGDVLLNELFYWDQ